MKKLRPLFILLFWLIPSMSMAVDDGLEVADLFQADTSVSGPQSVDEGNNAYLSVLLACFILSIFTVSCSARVYHKNYARCNSKLDETRSQLARMIPDKIKVYTQQLDQMLDEYEQLTGDIRELKNSLNQERKGSNYAECKTASQGEYQQVADRTREGYAS